MSIIALGYIGIGASDITDWRRFAADILGTQVTDGTDGGLLLRVDSRAWRIAIEPSKLDDILYAGWETAGPVEFASTIEQLRRADVMVAPDADLAKRRGVRDLVRFTDPAGVACELFWGATDRTEKPFISPVGGSGFLTGDQGLGHIVIAAPDPVAMQNFYTDLLGFKISDYIDMPMGPDKALPVTFMHCNQRHHSLAFAPAPSPKKLLHFMLQTLILDDVGFALDRIAKSGDQLSLTFGKHVNDYMLSFYVYAPSGFEIEYGFGARAITDPCWSVTRHDKISMWGHKFVGRPGTVQA